MADQLLGFPPISDAGIIPNQRQTSQPQMAPDDPPDFQA